MKKILGIVFCFILFACSRHQSKLDLALESSDKNRAELESVIHHYSQSPNDSLKLKAALFLIENMRWHHSYAGNKLNKYYSSIDSLFKTFLTSDELKQKLDSLNAELYFGLRLKTVMDLENIKAKYLIENIDNAFESYYTRNSSATFEVFCNYILPYRIVDEPVEYWRESYRNNFSSIDSLIRNGSSDSAICRAITELTKIVYYVPNGYKFNLAPSILKNLKIGDCVDYTNLGTYIGRSFGIPIANDFVIQWGNNPYRHEWNVLLLDEERFIPFQIGEYCEFGTLIKDFGHKKMPKVYRRTFSIQDESLFIKAENMDEDIPQVFKNPYIKDVTNLYIDISDISVIPDFKNKYKKHYAYIMCFDSDNWMPVYWGEKSKNSYKFAKMARNIMYLMASYENRQYLPLSYPFYINDEDEIIKLKPDFDKKRNVELKRKYFNYNTLDYSWRMNGGRFQGANRSNFSDAIDLHTIEAEPEMFTNMIKVDNMNRFQYFRYLSPDRSHGNIAELEVYDKSGKKLQGEIIGTHGSYENNGKDISKVFDGNPLTFFDSPLSDGSWVGLSFTKKEAFGTIKYIPRNDDNSIAEGQIYELYYWDNGWVSLGRKNGDASHILVYDNVPDNALLLLKNHSKGKEERIFTYEDGLQKWW